MTRNNLAEHLPWLLRHLEATHPAKGSLFFFSSSSSPSPSTIPQTASAVCNSGATAVATPRMSTPATSAEANAAASHASSLAGGSTTPSSTASTLLPPPTTRQPSAVATPIPPPKLPPPPTAAAPAAAAPTVAGIRCRIVTPIPPPKLPPPPPPPPAPTPARSPGFTLASSRRGKMHSSVVPSPCRSEFGSDIDLDDFDTFVDLTTDECVPSSTVSKRLRDVRTLPSARGKKRKSTEMGASPSKCGTSAEGRKQQQQAGIPDSDDACSDTCDNVFGDDREAKFPDVNQLLGFSLCSPISRRRTPTPKRLQNVTSQPGPRSSPCAEDSAPPKRRRRVSEHAGDDVVLDSEGDTTSLTDTSFITCPNGSTLEDLDDPTSILPPLSTLPADAMAVDRSEPEAEGGNEASDKGDKKDDDDDDNKDDNDSENVDANGDKNGDENESTQRLDVVAYWPSLRWRQHCLDEKIAKNTVDYAKALREKWTPARRLEIKGEKEPLLKEKMLLDVVCDTFKAYAQLQNDQEALLSAITVAYQNHQDTEAEENRLDVLSVALQDQEDALRAQLSEAAIDPNTCPADFDAGSPNAVVVPATQHVEGSVPPILTRSATSITESASQIVLQTQIPPPQIAHPAVDCTTADDSADEYFDEDAAFMAEVDNLPSMRGTGGSGRRPSPARPGPDLFSDFSDDIEMLQMAQNLEMQHSSGDGGTAFASRPPTLRRVLTPTSGNVAVPPRASMNAFKAPSAATNANASQKKKAPIPAALMHFPWSPDVQRALKDRFRMSGFRHNQLEAINATLSGNDAFVLMPTGGGKSLCYQLPAVISSGKTRGVTIVVSPLLSLMQDQVDHLKELNIAASSFNSSTPAAARKLVLDLFATPNPEHYLQLLYVTPEMVSKSDQFCRGLTSLYRSQKLARIVIDEAHCVSQWGHDFRPDYKNLGVMRKQFPSVPVMALTATATPNVIVDIKHNLSIDGCKVFSQSFNRPNLYYEVREKGLGCLRTIGDLIKTRYAGQSGIVYTLSQKSTVSIAKKLRQEYGVSAHHYHASIPPEEKAQVQRDWQRGRIKVVVATIAFGMGIDKPDVRFVVHYYLPKSLEGYYQETGRAGRDGLDSHCYLFFGYGDIKNLRKFITDSEGSQMQKQRQRDMLHRMVDFCENKWDCRRSAVLQYFGEEFAKENCGKTCDNCKNGGNFDRTDFSEYAVAALRVIKTYKLVTMVQCAEILQGKGTLDSIEKAPEGTCGIAKNLNRQDVHMMIYRLLSENALVEENRVNKKSDIAIQYFSLGPSAPDFLSGKKKLQLVIKVDDNSMASKEKRPKATKSKTVADKTKKSVSIAKKGKATAKRLSAPSSSKKARKSVPETILDEADVDFDGSENEGSGIRGGSSDDELEEYGGPMHANGYARDNFVVSDNDGEDENDGDSVDFELRPARTRRPPQLTKTRQMQLQQYAFSGQLGTSTSTSSQSSCTPQQRQRRLEELGGPISRDARLAEANVDPIHADIISAFVDEAQRVEERLRNEKGLRVLFTETHLREMAIGWTDTLDKMRGIRGIDAHHVRRFGAKFVPLVRRFHSMYQEMMGEGDADADGSLELLDDVGKAGTSVGGGSGGASSGIDAEFVDLVSSDDDDGGYNDGNYDDGVDDGDDISGGGVTISPYFVASQPSAVESPNAELWRAQLETLQTQTSTKSNARNRGGGSGSGGGGRKSRGGSRRGGFFSRGSGSSRNRSTSGGRSSGTGMARRKTAASSSAARGGAARGGSSSRSVGGIASGIGMMPL